MRREKVYLLPGVSADAIQNRTVLLGGVGAIGSTLAERLARFGVRRIKAVDKDLLEEHNVENQIYTLADEIGKPKVEILGKKIRAIDPEIEFTPIWKDICDMTEAEAKADIYFSCFDNFSARFFMNDMALFCKVPLIDAGIEGFTGTLRTIVPRKTPCFHCWPSLIPKGELKASCSKNPIPSTYLTASFAADLQVMAYIELVHNRNTDSYLFFDLEKKILGRIQLERNEDCIMCGGGSS